MRYAGAARGGPGGSASPHSDGSTWGARCAPYDEWPKLPTQLLLDELVARINGEPATFGGFGIFVGRIFHTWHCLFSLLAAVFGGFLARILYATTLSRATENTARLRSVGRGHLYRWTGLFVLYLGGLVLPLFVFFGGEGLPLGLWAGLTFLSTWLLLGLFALRAYFGRGQERDFWLAATLVGTGFLLVSFARFDKDPWPMSPTVEMLNDLRPWLPPVLSLDPDGWDRRTAQNVPVYDALERKVRMPFEEETTLDDVIKHIQAETVGADGKPIAIELGVLHGGGEVNLTMQPTVRSVDLSGVPLRTSLKLCLKQLDCTFHVKDGELLIHSFESDEEADLAAHKDVYQIVGHCILALLAAVIAGAMTVFLSAKSPAKP